MQRHFFWPVSLLPILLVYILSAMLMADGAQIGSSTILFVLLVWVGYFIYFNVPILWSKIRRKRSGQTLWGDKELSSNELYEFLKPKNFVLDHLVYSILTAVYAIGFTTLIGVRLP